MAGSLASARIKSDVLSLLRGLPPGYVTTFEAIGTQLRIAPRHVASILAALTEIERETVPWHRAVAKGGAIGRGAWRDQQFARLVREGVCVSPAGIVQDMARVAITNLKNSQVTKRLVAEAADHPTPPQSRSRGMRQRR